MYAIRDPSQNPLWIHSTNNNHQTFIYNIEGLVPSCASQIADSKKKLLEAYELATDAYM
jgi:hypothetical protein